MDPNKQKILSELTQDEWDMELKRREFANNIPVPLAHPDFTGLKNYCHENVKQIARTAQENSEGYGYAMKDCKHYIYEMAMKAVFGPDIFKWLNEHQYD